MFKYMYIIKMYTEQISEKSTKGEMEVKCCKKKLGWEQGSQQAEQPEGSPPSKPSRSPTC